MKREAFDEDYDFTVEFDQNGYSIFLLHQCGDWDILGDKLKPCPTKELAVKQMQLFIQRANEALECLKNV